MSKILKQEKAFWKKHFNYSSNLENLPHAMQHVNFRCTEVNDEAISFLTSRLKSIDRLDLDETEISNDAIAYLTRMENLKELRLKDNYAISDNCITELNRLSRLELLHLGNTSITIAGILQLKNLQKLKQLFFSVDGDKDIDFQILQLQELLPTCEIIINNQPIS